MCTAVVDLAPGSPLLLAGIRDELVDRAWQPPGRHWPDHPGLTGGRDLLAGGTWLAVAPRAGRVTCILNGRGRPAAPAVRRSRGVLPLLAADEGKLSRAGLEDFDPFHLLSAEPGLAVLWSWDGGRLTERELPPGLHVVVNSGLDTDLLAAGSTAQRDGARDHELARLAHFLPRLRAAPRPGPRPGGPSARAWGEWLPLINGDGLSPGDPGALIVRRDLGDGRVYGTTSVSLVALWPARPPGASPVPGAPAVPVAPAGAMRYDFTAAPGDPGAWHEVPLAD